MSIFIASDQFARRDITYFVPRPASIPFAHQKFKLTNVYNCKTMQNSYYAEQRPRKIYSGEKRQSKVAQPKFHIAGGPSYDRT